ncbi:hypothetical protein LTR62_003439 [Meristemomyces frigidus]|uniref:Uncharacterized protein n=1 Tax=Meristemomyces frigidus TaxID=1508187 RepID=A0AAN7TIL7_9PEZI|nr:hypothetical protein LTR62_003439 [Meristemomyces frigidus]
MPTYHQTTQLLLLLLLPVTALTVLLLTTLLLYTLIPLSAFPTLWQNANKDLGMDYHFYCPGVGSSSVRTYSTGTPATRAILWDPDLFLAITFGFGRFTFAQARVLDWVWMLVGGFGGQALLGAWVVWIGRRYVEVLESKGGVGFELSAALKLRPVSVRTTWLLLMPGLLRRRPSELKDEIRDHSVVARRVARWCWVPLVYSTMYLLCIPLLTALTTGYQATATANILLPDSIQSYPLTDLQPAALVLYDGPRVNKPEKWIISATDPLYPPLNSYHQAISNLHNLLPGDTQFAHCPSETNIPACTITAFASQCNAGVDCTVEITSNITLASQTYTLGSPALNISTDPVILERSLILAPSAGGGPQPVSFEREDVKQYTLCEATGDYKFGFAPLPLFISSLLTLFFFAAVLGMGIVMYRFKGRAFVPAEGRTGTLHRDILAMAAKLEERYGRDGGMYDALELRKVSGRGAGAKGQVVGVAEVGM